VGATAIGVSAYAPGDLPHSGEVARPFAHNRLEHFLELAKGAEAEKGSAILAALEEGNLHEAEDGIRALLGHAAVYPRHRETID
jgi:hypothetical protein